MASLGVTAIKACEGLFKDAGAGKFAKAIEGAKNTNALDKAASIFKSAPHSTPPLGMDARVTSAKLGVEIKATDKTVILAVDTTEQEYKIFKRKIGQEIEEATKSRRSAVYAEINPINANNIDSIKAKLISVVDDVELQQKISGCNTPEELFLFMKENIIAKMCLVNNCVLEKKLLLSGSTPELEKEYAVLANNQIKKVNEAISILTPKSTNPEVLRLEEEVRRLGIKDVNFSDDLERARIVKEAMEDLIKTKVPLPNSITVTPALATGTGGLGGHIAENRYMWLPKSKESLLINELESGLDKVMQNTSAFQSASAEFQTRCIKDLEALKNKVHSTSNSKHLIYHEAAHTFEPNSLAANSRVLTKEEMSLCGKISIYAQSAQNGKEAMPEMFAKLMDGQILTEKQMELYLKLGGIVPQF